MLADLLFNALSLAGVILRRGQLYGTRTKSLGPCSDSDKCPFVLEEDRGWGGGGSWMNQGGRNDITDYSYRGLFSLLSGSLIKLTSLYKQQMTKTLN